MNMKWICLALSFTAWAQIPPGMVGPEGERDEEGLAIGRVIAEILLDKPTSQRLNQIATMFVGDDRLHQAHFFYQQSLLIAPKDPTALAGLKAVEESQADLRMNYENYARLAESKGDIRDRCSMAAIKFHEGYPQESIEILNEALVLLPEQAQFARGLRTTFIHGVNLETALLSRLEKELELATFEKRLEDAAILCGRMFSVGLGKPRTVSAMKELQGFFPNKINKQSANMLEKLADFFTSQTGSEGE